MPGETTVLTINPHVDNKVEDPRARLESGPQADTTLQTCPCGCTETRPVSRSHGCMFALHWGRLHRCSRVDCRGSPPTGLSTTAGGLAKVSCALTICSLSISCLFPRGLSNRRYGLRFPRATCPRRPRQRLCKVLRPTLSMHPKDKPHVCVFVEFSRSSYVFSRLRLNIL
jgi:hypothetical protein